VRPAIAAGTGGNILVPGGGTDTFQTPPGATTPIVFADGYTVLANGVLNVAAGGVLANDLSPSANPLTAVLVGRTAHGTLALNADGSFRYTPAANFGGTDTFTYQARSSTGTLSIPLTAKIHVAYTLSGFLAPLNSNLAFGLGRTVPIKFQVTGSNGTFVSSLSAVATLQALNAQGVNVLSSEALSGQEDLADTGAARALHQGPQGFRIAPQPIHALVVLLGTAVRQRVAVPAAEVAAVQVELAHPPPARNVVAKHRAAEPPAQAAEIRRGGDQPDQVVHLLLMPSSRLSNQVRTPLTITFFADDEAA
jgi:hypothetical protein